MFSNHPNRLLVPYIRNELNDGERGRVDGHLDHCRRCRDAAASYREILVGLADLPLPQDLHWGPYRAELRRKLAARESSGAKGSGFAWRPRWIPLAAMSTALVAAIALFALRSTLHPVPSGSNAAFQEALIGEQLDLIRNYPVVEKMDLLEDYDVIEHLDELSSGSDGSDENQHHAGDLLSRSIMAGDFIRPTPSARRRDVA